MVRWPQGVSDGKVTYYQAHLVETRCACVVPTPPKRGGGNQMTIQARNVRCNIFIDTLVIITVKENLTLFLNNALTSELSYNKLCYKFSMKLWGALV